MSKLSIEYQREWRKNHSEEVKTYRTRNYQKVRDYANELKNVPCMDCGLSYPPYVMDFDHRENTGKLIDVNLIRSIPALLREVKKCDVVCANCHRIRTWERRIRECRSIES